MKFHSIRCALLLALSLAGEAACAEALGRLFFTPAERARLDQPPRDEAPAAPPPRLDGIITRSAGSPTLFLNGRAIAATPAQIRIQDGSARVVTEDGRTLQLRVGAPPYPAAAP